jgi:hypothetical protein
LLGPNGISVSQTSAYKVRLRTDSDDRDALLLLTDGELVAILVQLADESHEGAQGQWTIETTFGLRPGRRPAAFLSASDAADWVSMNICNQPFVLDEAVCALR